MSNKPMSWIKEWLCGFRTGHEPNFDVGGAYFGCYCGKIQYNPLRSYGRR